MTLPSQSLDWCGVFPPSAPHVPTTGGAGPSPIVSASLCAVLYAGELERVRQQSAAGRTNTGNRQGGEWGQRQGFAVTPGFNLWNGAIPYPLPREPCPSVVVTSAATMGRHLYIPGACALALVLTPLCHAFVPPATAHSSVKSGQIRNHATPIMSTSEFGGIQHAGVLVSDTRASKVSTSTAVV